MALARREFLGSFMTKTLMLFDDFTTKSSILGGLYPEVDPFTFYETLFSDKDLYTDTCIVSYGSDAKLSVAKHNPIQSTVKSMTFSDAITSSCDYANMYIPPATFFKGHNTVKCLEKLYAIVVDFDGDKDGVSEKLLYWVIERINENEDDLPAPTFVTNSGRGLHLFWVFETPVPMFSENKRTMKDLYFNIHQKLVDYNTKPQRHHFAQAYRIVGSKTKLDQVTTAYKTGTVLPVEQLLNDFDIDKKIIWQEGKNHKGLAPSEAMIKLVNNIEKTLNITCDDKGSWQCVHDFIRKYKSNFDKAFKLNQSKRYRKESGIGWGTYDWYLKMKQRIIEETPEGYRYTSLMAFMVIGYKCNVPFEQVKQDEYDIILRWQMRPKPFNVRFNEDYKDRVDDMYSEKFLKVNSEQLQNWLGFKFYPTTRRNGRKREQHIKIMDAIRDIEYPDGTWRNKDGRPKGISKQKDIILLWRSNHPEGKPKQCIEETGLSKNTVYRWWDSENNKNT